MEESLPNVAELEDQFAAQQSMIEHMRDTLLQREQTVTSNEKKVQDFAATLSRIRSSHRPNKKKEDARNTMALDVTPEKGPSSKMNLLRQQMEENRAILEQRNKLISEHKQSVEGMVEMLSAQLTEKDIALEEVRRSRQAQESLPTLNPSSEECRELYAQVIARDNKIIELNNKILQLERSIMDYEESLREKESVLEARTRAVALVQEDLGLKHAAAVQHLDEARREAAQLKLSLAEKEEQLKAEKKNLLETVASKEQKLAQLESVRFDLCTRNAELQHKIVALQTKSHEVLSQGLPQDKETIQDLESKIIDLETSTSEEITALKTKVEETTKLLAKTKVAYSKKIKSVEQKLKQQQPNVQDLEQKIAELEEEKGNLQLMLVDFEEIKAGEKMLQQRVADMEAETLEQKARLETQTNTINQLEETSSNTFAELQELRASEAELQAELEASKNMVQESECAAVRANMKTVELEERLEHAEKAYKELTADVESLVAQKETAEDSKVRDVLDSVAQDKSVLQTEMENLRAQLSAQQVVAEEAAEALLHAQQTLALKVTEHEAEVETLHAQIAAKEERVCQLEERISCLSEESQQSMAQLNYSMEEAHQAQEALSKVESMVNQEGSKLDEAELKIRSLETQIQELKGALSQANQCQLDESQARSQAQAEVRELRLQLESNAVQLESGEETLAALETLKAEHDKMLKRHQEEIAAWQCRCEQAEDEVSSSTTQVEQMHKDHQAAMDGWNNEIQLLKEQMSRLEDENNDLHEQIENLNLEKQRVESELWNAMEDLSNEKESHQQLQQENQQQTELERQNFTQEINSHVTRINELEQSLSTVQAEASSHQNVVVTIQQEMQRLHENKNVTDQACSDLKSKLQSAEETLNSLRAESDNLKSINNELQSQLNSYQNQASSVQGLNEHMAHLNNELEQLRWALGEKDLTLQSLAQEVQTYESQNSDLRSQVKQLEDSLTESDYKRQQLVETCASTQGVVYHLHSQASAQEAATNYRVSELEAANANLQTTLNQQKTNFEQESNYFRAEVEKLNQKLIEAQMATKSAIVPDEISWGEEPSWQESGPQPTMADNSSALLIDALQKQLKEAEESQAKLAEDLRTSQVRCGKALKQLKTIKEQKKPAADLDKVLEEELQSRVVNLQKELAEVKADREALSSKAETLRDANTRLTESKKQLDLEIERLKVERLALEEEASDWGQDDRIVALEKQLRDAHDRCKDLEEHIIGDEEAESESLILQENLVKARERCVELERLKLLDEEKLQLLESQLASANEQFESLKSSIPSPEVAVELPISAATIAPVQTPAPQSTPVCEEVSTMTEELVRAEVSVNTEEAAPVVSLAAAEGVSSAEVEAAAYEMAKVRASLAEKQQEADALAALVSQLRGALENKSVQALRSPDPSVRADLDSALYLLHQRDVRCDELTHELMQLMEERDGLQLRLSSALRVNATQAEQLKEAGGQPEDLQLKLSELHSVGHKRDVMLRGEQETRHSEQQAAFMPTSPNLHFTPHQRTLNIEETPQQEGSSGLLGWLWGY